MAPIALVTYLLAAADLDLPMGRAAPPAIAAPPPVSTPAPSSAPAARPAPPATAPVAAVDADSSDGSLAPKDDYGYVAFCYGAESAYLDLYDQVMPQVERIERAFPGPTPIDEALAEYPQLRADSRADVAFYSQALSAAERVSATPLAQTGVQSIELGRSTWAAAARATPAQVAQAWMGWSPADDCHTRAQTLIDKGGKVVASSGPGGQSAVELDKLAAPVLAASAQAPAATLALATPAPAPPPAAPATPAAPSPDALGVNFGAGLGVSFADAPAATGPNAAASAPPPGALPALVTAAPSAAAEPPIWRGPL